MYADGERHGRRHIALQFDDVSNDIRVFLDGSLVASTDAVKPIADVDISPAPGAAAAGGGGGAPQKTTKLALGHSHPGYTYGREVEVYDLRLYVGSRGVVSEADIAGMAAGEAAALDPALRCVPAASDDLADTDWSDTFGHACSWFFEAKKQNPQVCDFEEARVQCPLSCASRQACYQGASRQSSSPEAYFAWDRTRLIIPQTASGTLCLLSGHAPRYISQSPVKCRMHHYSRASLVVFCGAPPPQATSVMWHCTRSCGDDFVECEMRVRADTNDSQLRASCEAWLQAASSPAQGDGPAEQQMLPADCRLTPRK